jgi:putative spermidine/putrescine transport system permease protein
METGGRQTFAIILLLFPSLAVLAVLFGYPLYEAFLGSIAPNDPRNTELTLSNYIEIFENTTSLKSFYMTVYYSVIPVFIALFFSTPLAALIQRSFIGRKLFNGIYKIPIAIPAIVATFMAMTLLDQGGFISRLLDLSGISMPKIVRDEFAIGVLITLAWKDIPFMTLIITGAFGAISQDVINAARAYGASRFRTFLIVQVPLALPSIVAAMVLTFIRSIGSFAVPDILGPGYPLPLSVTMYRAYTEGNWQVVYATGMIMTMLAVGLLIVFYTILGRSASSASKKMGV